MLTEQINIKHKGNTPDLENPFLKLGAAELEKLLKNDLEFRFMLYDYLEATTAPDADKLFDRIKEFILLNTPDDPRYPNLNGLDDKAKQAALDDYQKTDDADREKALNNLMSGDFKQFTRICEDAIEKFKEYDEQGLEVTDVMENIFEINDGYKKSIRTKDISVYQAQERFKRSMGLLALQILKHI